jgi:hypothetical protein
MSGNRNISSTLERASGDYDEVNIMKLIIFGFEGYKNDDYRFKCLGGDHCITRNDIEVIDCVLKMFMSSNNLTDCNEIETNRPYLKEGAENMMNLLYEHE